LRCKKAQPAILDEVAERHDEQQADAVTDLRHRDDEARGRRRKPKRLSDRPDERLRIVDVGDDEPAGGRKQQRRSGRNLRLTRGGLRPVQPIHP
jgi:hypothetical protein